MTGIVLVALLLLTQVALAAMRGVWDGPTFCYLAAAVFLFCVLVRLALDELRDRRFRRAIAERVRR